MSILEIVLIALSLSSDALGVAISKGLSARIIRKGDILKVGLYFGIFQAIMPYLGYLISSIFGKYLIRYSHILAFLILGILGIMMIIEKIEESDDDFSFKKMLPASLGTSIDALAVGITFTIMDVNILLTIMIIGVITFFNSCIGVILGYKLKSKIIFNPGMLGGIILILLSFKMLIEAFI